MIKTITELLQSFIAETIIFGILKLSKDYELLEKLGVKTEEGD